MATRFEFALHGANPAALRAAAEEALDEVERLENLLSLYRPHTDIARVNARAAAGPVRVAPEVFRLIERAFALSALTEGAFDITAGPLIKVWGFMGGSGSPADPVALAEARACVGPELVELDSSGFTVRFRRAGVMLDLGSIGKGHALDRAAEILREAGVTSALLHGGTSTVVALGTPPEADAWQIALPTASPISHLPSPISQIPIPLRDESLSVSAGWGKSFTDGSRVLGHVIDPRSGEPVAGVRCAAVVGPTATDSDALSTALLVAGRGLYDRMAAHVGGFRAWLDGVPAV
jgi:thiamine biosynthesis lipoprotein